MSSVFAALAERDVVVLGDGETVVRNRVFAPAAERPVVEDGVSVGVIGDGVLPGVTQLRGIAAREGPLQLHLKRVVFIGEALAVKVDTLRPVKRLTVRADLVVERLESVGIHL